jgi:hypothetical protein
MGLQSPVLTKTLQQGPGGTTRRGFSLFYATLRTASTALGELNLA